MTAHQSTSPQLGFGLGLRPQHYQYIFEHQPAVDWFEIISENYMDTDGPAKRRLGRIRNNYPVVMHGVSLSIGTVDPINSVYITKLKALANWLQPAWISDHLCWTGVAHKNTHDLLPVPYTEEALAHIVRRIAQVQELLDRPLTLENPSTYLEFANSTMSESEFISRMVKESGCKLLLDVNNIYVSCFNHGADPKQYIDSMPLDQVIQIHLAGHQNNGTHIIDTHDDHVVDEVWALYKYTVSKAKRVPNTMIEWDDKIPAFEVLFAELTKARRAAADAESYGSLPAIKLALQASYPSEPRALGPTQELVQSSIMQTTEYTTDWIKPSGLAPDLRLSVYRNAYRQRLREVIATDFPALKHYLGEEQFSATCDRFIDISAPSDFNIGSYALRFGESFARTSNDRFAAELCELESTISELLDVEESPSLRMADLHELSAETIGSACLIPRPAARLLAHTGQANNYYQDFMNGECGPESMKSTPSWVAAFRESDVVWRLDLEDPEYLVLKEIFAGRSVGSAIDAAASAHAATINETQIQAWFSRWVSAGMFTSIKI